MGITVLLGYENRYLQSYWLARKQECWLSTTNSVVTVPLSLWEGGVWKRLIFKGNTIHISLSLVRSVGFTGDAAAAVHYALHYLGDLVEMEGGGKRSGRISNNEVLHPCLQLPDVFELLHLNNQVAPMFILESVIGKSQDSDYLTVVPIKDNFCTLCLLVLFPAQYMY